MAEKETSEDSGKEKALKGIGQEILGDLEIIGGMLTGDPLTTAEGKFNVSIGEEIRERSEAPEDENGED